LADHTDTIRRVYAHIKQLAEYPPELVYQDDVDRYHELLNKLDAAGYEVDDFRFDEQRDMYDAWYGASREMRPDIFFRQVRALALYFEVRDKTVRFTAPQKDES